MGTLPLWQSLPNSSQRRQPCTINRPKEKGPEDDVALQEKYASCNKGNEFHRIPEALEAVTTRTISLLTTDVKTQRINGVSRDTMEEAHKSLQIQPKVLAKVSAALWDILLESEEEAKKTPKNPQKTN